MKVGDQVKILECHMIPGIVGMTGRVVKISEDQYPVAIELDKPVGVAMPILGGVAMGMTSGPFVFREEELEVVGGNQPNPEGEGVTKVPDVFEKGMGQR